MFNSIAYFFPQSRGYDDDLTEVVQSNTLVRDEVNYLAATYDYVTGVAKIYINGNLTVETATPPANGGHRLATQGEIRFGGWQNDGWEGVMHCVQIYNKALNDAEIADLVGVCPLRKFELNYVFLTPYNLILVVYHSVFSPYMKIVYNFYPSSLSSIA